MGTAHLTVSDNGIGMHQSLIDDGTVFRPFAQLDASRGQADSGFGLGLAIVQRLVDLLPEHGFGMRSAPSVGTTATLTAPLSPGRAGLDHEATRHGPAPDAQIAGRFVIVLEDDPVVCRSFSLLLEAHDVNVIACADYAGFAAVIASLERRPDLLVSDFKLSSGKSAMDAVHLLDTEWPGVPKLVITGEVSAGTIQQALPGCMVLRKPIEARNLVEAIAQCIRRQPMTGHVSDGNALQAPEDDAKATGIGLAPHAAHQPNDSI